MSAKPEAAESEKAPAKSKKMLIIIIVAVLALGGGGFVFMSKRSAAAAAAAAGDGEEEEVVHAKPKTPPVYMPLDNMVVNLADPGGDKVAQVGITLQVADAHSADEVKVYLPKIRSGILLLISQRTADELLSREGKEKLAEDILEEASIPFGGGGHGDAKSKKKASGPVRAVLFSSFIVQ